MADLVVYNPTEALARVSWFGRHMFGWQVKGLRKRYIRVKDRAVFGWLLVKAEKKAWRVAWRAGRLSGAVKKAIAALAAVSNAARNAGLAVLVRDLIPKSLFTRLTRVWRAALLPLPKGPQRRKQVIQKRKGGKR